MSSTSTKSDQSTAQIKKATPGTFTKQPPAVICDQHGKVWDGPHI